MAFLSPLHGFAVAHQVEMLSVCIGVGVVFPLLNPEVETSSTVSSQLLRPQGLSPSFHCGQ